MPIGSRVNPLRLPLIRIVAINSVLAILALFLFDASLPFFALLAAVAHDSSFKLFAVNVCIGM